MGHGLCCSWARSGVLRWLAQRVGSLNLLQAQMKWAKPGRRVPFGSEGDSEVMSLASAILAKGFPRR